MSVAPFSTTAAPETIFGPEPSRLGTWDYVTFCGLVTLASCVGVYHIFAARKSKNTREFLVTSHDLGVGPLILSTAATFLSAIGILGFPMQTYMNGAAVLLVCVSHIIILPVGCYLYIPVFFNLGTTTIFEYLEYRFNKFIRKCASALLMLQLILYTSVVMYAPALALNQVTGIHIWASVVSIGIICIIYTSMGGIKAVVWADACQISVMLAVVLTIVIKGCADVGGIHEVWRICTEGNRASLFIFTPSPYSIYTFWTMVVGASIQNLSITITNQMLMQRYLSNKTLRNARLSFVGGNVCIAFMLAMCCTAGLVIYARYHDCDPQLNGQVTSRDQLLALFAIETLSFFEGLPGIFVAAILCATLSTLSSTLNSLSALTIEDFIRPMMPKLTEATATKLAKVLAVTYGLICIALVALAENTDGVIETCFTINGVTAGPIFAIFTMGMLVPWINTKGATIGIFTTFLLCGWAAVGSMVTKPIQSSGPIDISGCNNTRLLESYKNATDVYRSSQESDQNHTLLIYGLSPLWYSSWSVVSGLVVGIITSILTGVKNPEDVDPKLLFPIVSTVIRKLPRNIQAYLGFNTEKSRYCQLTLTSIQTSDLKPPSTNVPIIAIYETQDSLEKTQELLGSGMPINRGVSEPENKTELETTDI